MHSPLLRISNPQSLNRLGHFLTPDFKSGGTPSGLAFLFYIRRDANVSIIKVEVLIVLPLFSGKNHTKVDFFDIFIFNNVKLELKVILY